MLKTEAKNELNTSALSLPLFVRGPSSPCIGLVLFLHRLLSIAENYIICCSQAKFLSEHNLHLSSLFKLSLILIFWWVGRLLCWGAFPPCLGQTQWNHFFECTKLWIILCTLKNLVPKCLKFCHKISIWFCSLVFLKLCLGKQHNIYPSNMA